MSTCDHCHRPIDYMGVLRDKPETGEGMAHGDGTICGECGAKALADEARQKELRDSAPALFDEVLRLRALLFRVEWAPRSQQTGGAFCPVCGNFKSFGHAPGCWLGEECERIRAATGGTSEEQ